MNYVNCHSNNCMSAYIINQDVEALFPCLDENGFLCTKIILKEDIVYVRQSPFKIVQASSLEYGSDAFGRWKAAKNILQAKQKVPLPLSMLHDLVMIPLHSPHNPDCIWLSYSQVYYMETIDEKSSVVHFKSGNKLELPFKKETIEEKVHRAAFVRDEIIRRCMKGFGNEVPPVIWYILTSLLNKER